MLETFAEDLHRRGVPLYMIAVNHQLKRAPYIRDKVEALDAAGRLTYIEVADWFNNVTDWGSPEGHAWGAKAHSIVGEGLARYFTRARD